MAIFPASKALGINKLNSKPVSSRPLLNEQLLTHGSDPRRQLYSQSGLLMQKRMFWKWFREQPELSSPISIRVNDTIKNMEFFTEEGRTLGRNKQREMNKFWKTNFMRQRMKSVWFDSACTGSGFGWMGFPDKESLGRIKGGMKMLAGKVMRQLASGGHRTPLLNELQAKELGTHLYLKAIDEDLRKPRVFDHVASSTMEINYDAHDITGYTQYVGTDTANYSPDEIIHFPFMSVDGRVNGHTPVSSMKREMILLWFIKENMISYVRNGGRPDKIFVLPEDEPNSENFQHLSGILKTLNSVQNRNGNLTLTGKVDVHDLAEKIRDMEYKDLALYITGNIAYGLQIPVTRIPYLIGQSQSGGDSGGLADSGYWSMIESDQEMIEQYLDTQLWNHFGVSGVFKKSYKMDDLREAQSITMKADAISKAQAIFAQYGKQMSINKILNMMDMRESDVEKAENDMSSMGQGLNRQNQLNNIQLEGDTNIRREGKRREQMNSSASDANK